MGDGVEALKKLRYARFDVLLTDLMMTAVGSDDLRQQALQAGADEFLIKPY
jgi:CheY-like chemotaxis protein